MSDPGKNLDGPLKCLRPATLQKLSQSLNPQKVLLTPEGHLRDWRGVAELMGFDALAIKNFEETTNPFLTMLFENRSGKVSDLQNCLEIVDRFDTVDDCQHLIEQDLVAYNDRLRLPAAESSEILNISETQNHNIIEYDALLLFSDDDRSFAEEIIQKMETEYKLRLCVKDRDLIAGHHFEYRAVTDLIENRCRFVLPVFSPSFLESEDNKFVVAFSEALGIDKGCRKIVPCLYRPCTLPKTLSYYSRLDFTRANSHFNFWDKMYRSLAEPSRTQTKQQVSVNTDVPVKLSEPSASVLKTSESDSALLKLEKKAEESTTSKNWLKKIISKPKKEKKKKTAVLAS